MQKILLDIAKGEEGKILEIKGGWGMQKRLHSMGLSEGKVVRKVSSLGMGGPVIILVNRAQIAIGRGMARKIIVEPLGKISG